MAIERPDGLLVDRLLDAGFTVLPVHPNKLKATRPRYEAAGGKSDGFDAFCLAELARTDSHRLRSLAPDSDETKALRALTRTREDLVGARVRLAMSCAPSCSLFGPAQQRSSPTSTPRSVSPSWSATPRPPMPGGLASSDWKASSLAIATAAGAPPSS